MILTASQINLTLDDSHSIPASALDIPQAFLKCSPYCMNILTFACLIHEHAI